ncbi:MAG: hypothetical protein QOC72_289 [Methylobacteriaceae bacterium]|jgi:hypothetical protein|nr:hypothetical protein [Methylobacteriaceae bacterium]
MKFSQAFRLDKVQAELDFVDINTARDTRLFLDPYAIQIKQNLFSEECSTHIRVFFAEILACLRERDVARAQHLTGYLTEPQETFLGFSKGRPRGRGMGRFQADQLLAAFRSSRAFRTGILSDLSEAELFVAGIAQDKISDLTTNVLRGPLIRYTQAQCNLHGVKLDEVPSGAIWNPSAARWEKHFVPLPLIQGQAVILVPKYFVRWRLSLDSQEFYNHHMLSYLREENLEAHSSLVQFFKNGEPYVTKKRLKQEHPFAKDALADFARKHPEVLEKYKELAGARGSLENEDFDRSFNERTFAQSLRVLLREIPAGMQHAGRYHSFTMGVLTFLFYPHLINPTKELELNEGRKRIDIVFTNAGESGFFSVIARSRQMRALMVIVECKNYNRELGNPELDQICGRFSHTRGYFGMLLCRQVFDERLMERRCKDLARDKEEYVLVLDDEKVSRMLRLVEENRRDDIQGYLHTRLARLNS